MRPALRILPASLCAALFIPMVTGAALFWEILPAMEREAEERMAALPRYLALSNRSALLRRDLSTLSDNVEAFLADDAKGDILYIYFLDADGKPLASGFHETLSEAERAAVVEALRRPASVSSSEAKTPAVEEVRRLAEKGEERELPPGMLPPIRSSYPPRPLGIDNPRVLDVAFSIEVGGRAFGGIRVGFRDRLSERHDLLLAAYGLFAAVVFFGLGGGGWWMARRIEADEEEAIRVGVAAERRRLEENFNRRLRAIEARQEEDSPLTASEFFALLDTAKRLGQTLDYNEILALAVQAAAQTLDARDVSIFLLDPETNELYGRMGRDESGEIAPEEMGNIRIPVGQGDIGLAAEFGTTAVIDQPKPGAALVSAMVARGKVIGVILVRNKVTGKPMQKKDALVLRQLSALIGGALENAALYYQATEGARSGGGRETS